MNSRNRRRKRRRDAATKDVPEEFPESVSARIAREREESAREADARWMASMMATWHRENWLRLLGEVLRLVAAALAGFGGGQVAG